jgi:hypothetical protein
MTRSLSVSFTRHRGRNDQVEVTRSNGTSVSWDFPSYGDVLPHDMIHLVVEEGLGMQDGFWGLVDQGADVVTVNEQAVLSRNGRPLSEEPGIDFEGLVKAEEAVALLGPQPSLDQVGQLTIARPTPDSFDAAAPSRSVDKLGFRLPDSAAPGDIAAIRSRLRHLAQRWRDLDEDTITVTWRRDIP